MKHSKKNRSISICFLLFTIFAAVTTAQNFTWMHGSSSFNQVPVYGSQGSASPNNTPGARLAPVTWKDLNGNLWLFGGRVNNPSQLGFVLRNDLWKFNPVSNEWTFMKGGTVLNQYGTCVAEGVANAANAPGCRTDAQSWTDAAGNLWLYGGVGYTTNSSGDLSDLWKYEIATNMWTCVSGSSVIVQQSVRGTMGVANSTNRIGTRRSASTWTDLSGNLWLFGGLGFGSIGFYGGLNEVWKYDPTAKQWTWMGGGGNGLQNGNYGSLGVPAVSNMPGGRQSAACSADAFGNILIVGGNGYGISGNSALQLNDVWRFNTATNQWTWIGGSNTTNQFGNYGTQGVSAPTNMPGCRTSSCFWTEADGTLYLFGGQGFSSVAGNSLNDFWQYKPGTNEWTWIKGSNLNGQAGVNGTLMVPAATNIPGAKSGAGFWIDHSGNFWLHGGYTPTANAISMYSELWKYSACNSISPTLSVISSQTAVCAGQQVTLTASGANYYSWNGLYSAQIPSVVVTPMYSSTYAVTGQDNNGCSSTTLISIYVDPQPNLTVTATPAIICEGESSTLNVAGANSYSWNVGSTSNQIIVSPMSATNYTVTGSNALGCSTTATYAISVAKCTGLQNNQKSPTFSCKLYPNPFCTETNFQFNQVLENAELRLYSAGGELVRIEKGICGSGFHLEKNNLTAGLYFVELIQSGSEIYTGKLILLPED